MLRLKGYRILARRYETPVGLIDFVALKDSRLAFIEVKRHNLTKKADWIVPAKQRRRIIRAAQYWLTEHPEFIGKEIAFGLVLAAPFALPRYIANAFRV
jgi:putative endonuclease